MRIQNINYLINNHGYDKPFYYFDNMFNGYIYKSLLVPDYNCKRSHILLNILDNIKTVYYDMVEMQCDVPIVEVCRGIFHWQYVYSTFEESLAQMPRVYTNILKSELKIRSNRDRRPVIQKLLKDLKTPVTQLIVLDAI